MKDQFAGIHRKGGGPYAIYEIMTVFLEILALLISFGSLSLCCLPFSTRETNVNKKTILSDPQDRRCP
jgi:homospermidine synthase